MTQPTPQPVDQAASRQAAGHRRWVLFVACDALLVIALVVWLWGSRGQPASAPVVAPAEPRQDAPATGNQTGKDEVATRTPTTKPAPPATGNAGEEEGDGATGSELLQKLQARDIPPVADLHFHTDLGAGREEARRFLTPLVHILVRGRDDPLWLSLRDQLDANKPVRSILSTCALVITAQADLPDSPTIAIHSTEVVTPDQGEYRQAEDGGTIFAVHSQPNGVGFVVPAAPLERSSIPGAIGHVKSPDGKPVVRHRVVDVLAGVPSVHDLGRRLWLVVRNDFEIDELLQNLHQGGASEEQLRQLLADRFYGLISPDDRIQAAIYLLEHCPEDLWAVHRTCQIFLDPQIKNPTAFLQRMREVWSISDSPQRLLLESQVALTRDGNREQALTQLRRAVELAPGSPYLWERLARCALVGARQADDIDDTLRLTEIAAGAVSELRRFAPSFPGLWSLEQGVAALRGLAPGHEPR